MFNLEELLEENTKIIEIYFLNEEIKDYKKINIISNDKIISLIKNKYKNNKISKFVSYYRNELIYTYELDDDNQSIISKTKLKDKIDKKIYSVAYNDIKVSSHLYPPLNDISNKSEYILYIYKITNRINIIIKEEDDIKIVYIEYKHSNNVDKDKIQKEINEIINYLT